MRDLATEQGRYLMTNYLKDIWGCRYFWLSLVKMDLRTRYRRSVLGIGWSLLNPIAMTIILTTVFCTMLGQGDPKKYALYLITGLATWQYVLNVSLHGCQCFFLGEQYIRQHPAPLAIYPLRTALGGTVHFIMALSVVLCLAAIFNGGFPRPDAFFSLIPSVLLLFMLGWSLAVLTGSFNVMFQDTQHLAEVGFQILFYATPIMYRLSDITGKTVTPGSRGYIFVQLMAYNPLVAFLDLVRDPILHNQVPSLATYGTAILSVSVLASAASAMLVRQQKRLIFYL
jgi:ABC-type polysaccharide/polyol phosphate export permease